MHLTSRYPDKWIDYSSLHINDGQEFLAMIIASRAFDYARDVEEMAAPTDKDKWFMTPQTINAYYHPSLNEIVFPAAILQPPFFDPSADDAVNFGAMVGRIILIQLLILQYIIIIITTPKFCTNICTLGMCCWSRNDTWFR